jgi:hypothetical protein
MIPALTGCLDAPPQYQVPEQVPPVITMDTVIPPTSSLNRPSRGVVQFKVPFRADDAGEELRAYFIRDIPSGKPDFTHVLAKFVSVNADPRPFAEQASRYFEWPWDNIVDVGCHTVTLILSYASNFNTANGAVEVTEATRAAYVTWFFELPDSTGAALCGDWPAPSTVTKP